MILGSSERVSQESQDQTREVEQCPSRYDPGIVRVSQESQDTQTREVELCPSRDDPGIVRVSQVSLDTQAREVELCPSRDDLGTVRVSQDSQDLSNMLKHVQSNLGNPLRIIDILGGYWTSLLARLPCCGWLWLREQKDFRENIFRWFLAR